MFSDNDILKKLAEDKQKFTPNEDDFYWSMFSNCVTFKDYDCLKIPDKVISDKIISIKELYENMKKHVL